MKHFIALVFLCCLALPAFADNPPKLSARQALDAAQKTITDRGLDKEIYIASVSLTTATFLGGETFWVVKYSHPIPAEKPNQHETGIKVRMDGTVTRLVKTLGKP